MSSPQIQQVIADAEAGRPDAQFLMSQICMQNQDWAGMHRWLQKASASGISDANAELGQCYEKGRGVAPDVIEAARLYDVAVEAGSKMGAFNKAQLLHKSARGTEQQDLIRELLVSAAEAGVVLALRTIAYLALQSDSLPELARGCLTRAADAGDPVSCFNLGWNSLTGRFGEAAEGEANHWLQLAAKANYPLAATVLSTVAGDGARPATSTTEINFDAEFALYPKKERYERKEINAEPRIAVFDDVLDATDRAYLMFLSRPNLQRAAVIDPEGDESGMVSQVRTSKSTYIPFEHVDIISRYAELKIVVATGEDFGCSEPMSILSYAPGEYYRPHFDFFNPRLDVSRDFMQDGGQRMASAVTYLIAPSAGGGTSFPELGLTVPAIDGGTLWFRNCFADGEVDNRSLHAGDSVEAGEKWVVTKWFRERPTSYTKI
jgi:prolyl 4-hydroxylase